MRFDTSILKKKVRFVYDFSNTYLCPKQEKLSAEMKKGSGVHGNDTAGI